MTLAMGKSVRIVALGVLLVAGFCFTLCEVRHQRERRPPSWVKHWQPEIPK